MQISNGKSVSIEFTMSSADGETIETNAGADPLTFIQGDHEIFSGLEKALEGMSGGETKKIILAPDETFGPVHPDATVTVPVDHLPSDAQQVGMMIQTEDPQGQTIKGQVAAITNGNATIDFNHPLAGQALTFDIKIISVTKSNQIETDSTSSK